MSLIRIEPVKDATTDKYYVEIYFPADAPQPFVTTAPRYKSVSAAEIDTIAIIAAAANTARQDVVDEDGSPATRS